jgi:ComF family protein
MLHVRVAGVISASCEALLPSLCLHCGEAIAETGVGLCGDCWARVLPVVDRSCPLCGSPATDTEEPCVECACSSPIQDGAVVWGEYDGPLRTILLAMKNRSRDELAEPIGRRLAARLALVPWIDNIDLVTHVPSHPIRRLRRGWSVAACVALVIARELVRPARHCLSRHGLARQTGRSRVQRLQLPRHAFSCSATVKGRHLLLIDDVKTTGTTLRRSAEAVRRAGADAVYFAVVARAPEARSVT